MNNKKISKIVLIIVISIVLLLSVSIFILNYTKSDNNYSILEKKWITDNKINIIDASTFNDIPIYGYNGDGVIFDLLDNISNDLSLNFNKISYLTDTKTKYSNLSFRVVNDSELDKEKDIIIYKDTYVIVSKDNIKLDSINNIDKVGIIEEEESNIKYYLNDKMEIIKYDDTNKLIDSLLNNQVNYIIVPNIMNMDIILKNKLNIVYNIDNLNKNIVIRSNDKTLYNIINKYYNNYLTTKYNESFSKNYLNAYFTFTNTSDIDIKNYNNKIYKYGYTVNMPYENIDNKLYVGTISNYLKDFSKIFNIEIEYIPYKSIDSIKKALVSNEIDFAIANFNYENINMDSIVTDNINNYTYVVLSTNNIEANDIKSFKDYKINVLGSSYLYNILTSNNIKTNIYNNTNELLRNINTTDIVIMDLDTYIYYKDTKLKPFKIVYQDTLNDGYRFIFNKNSGTIQGLVNYYINTITYNKYRYNYNTTKTISKDNTNVLVLSSILVIVIIIIVSIYLLTKSDRTLNKKERIKYIDSMTGLKNRNYLNQNINKWDDNVIFPQAVIMININELSNINDSYGRLIGDEVIKKVSSVLINNQKENSDIIRTSGDEFLIYLVGYEESFIKEYISTLGREIKKIPKSYGATFGYSMINDEVKIIDDAINEALIMLKEKRNK